MRRTSVSSEAPNTGLPGRPPLGDILCKEDPLGAQSRYVSDLLKDSAAYPADVMNQELLYHFKLSQFTDFMSRFEKPAIGFSLTQTVGEFASRSKLGGRPLLTENFVWPRSKKRVLDFVLQIDLAELARFTPSDDLPSSGLLTFFYDLENQPWGYDPAELDGFRVEFVDENSLVPHELPSMDHALREHTLLFHQAMTLPQFGSRAYDELNRESGMSNNEADRYFDFLAAYESRYYPAGKVASAHRLFGHAANIQGDMQLEAQLVTNGLYCGDPSGYHDPRAKELESGADDWVLLLQLDSDDHADLMWGDAGMLYYWIRSADLAALRFDRTWMTLQCC